MPKPAGKPGREPLPPSIYALFAVRLVVSAGAFVQPFLTMILTIKLGWDGARAGLFMAFVPFLSALGLMVGGKLGDAIGNRRTLAGLQLGCGAILLLQAALGFGSWTPPLLALASGVLSGSWPSINALVADLAPEERRKEAFSLLYWGNNIGFSVGPLLAGWLFVAAPRMLFAGNALALGVAAATVLAFVPRDASRRQRHAAEGPSVAAASRGSTWAILKADPVLLVYCGLAALTAFVYNQQGFALPMTLAEAMGPVAGPKAFGLTMTSNGLTVVIATGLVALASRRLSSLAAVALGTAFYAVGFGAYGLATSLSAFLGATVFWTIGEILGATNGNAFVAERAPPSHRARVNAFVSLSYVSGNIAAPLVAGPLAAAFGARAVWAPIAIAAALASAGGFALSAWDRARGPRRPPGLA